MGKKAVPRSTRALTVQIGIGLVVLAAAALAPPSRGAVLLLPLSGTDRTAVVGARELGLPILGLGPVGGSLTVMADRSTFGAMLTRGVLAVRGTSPGCSGAQA